MPEEAGGGATPELSVVVPVYNEAGNIEPFIERLERVLADAGIRSYEIVFAADPCTDDTAERVLEARSRDDRVKLLVFSRRFGQPAATLAGIAHATGRAVVVMDVDLQDPPELLTTMVEKWREGYEVVYAKRRSRKGETLVKRLVANAGYAVIARFGEVDIPRDTGDFRLMDRRVVDELLRFPEAHGFLRGMVALVGFKQVAVEFDRDARLSGKGNYNRFLGSLRIGLNGLICFSTALLNLSTIIGVMSAMLAILTAVAYAVLKLGFSVPFPIGNPTIVVLLLLLGGVQLICLGIIGQYIGRIYEEVKRRPRFIVAHHVGFDEKTIALAANNAHA